MNQIDKKKIALAVATASMATIGVISVKATGNYIENKRIEKQLKEQQELEEKRLSELKNKYPGVGIKGLDDAYDARLVSEKLNSYNYSNDEKIVFLTFDDGPSTTVTPEILRTLRENDVRGTFFVLGETIERSDKNKELLKEIYKDGNAIANHSYSHDYKKLYPGGSLSIENFINDYNKNENLIKSILGEDFRTRVIRCPGGYMSWKGMAPLKEYSNKTDSFISVDWNALNGDAQGKKKNEDELVEYTINTSKGKDIVVLLMHDTYGKENTAKSLDRIIKHYKSEGYSFKVLG